MRKTIFVSAMMMLAVVGGVAIAQRRENISSRSVRNDMKITVDSVMFRNDVSRIYCRLTGTPHTSQRIDAATLHDGTIELEAIDIDPIYFTRSFQWEDEPDMNIEIDFPALTPAPEKFTLTVKTPRGNISAKYPRAK